MTADPASSYAVLITGCSSGIGAVAALVNNAGYSPLGAFEGVPMERVRAGWAAGGRGGS